MGEGTIPIDPHLGYFWFMMSGIGRTAPGGIFLGWALGKHVSYQRWGVRFLILIILLILLFAWPALNRLKDLLLKTNSSILFPNADMDIYSSE